MVDLSEVRKTNASLISQPLVAVFIGATSGIGEAGLRELVKLHASSSHSLRIYLVGRKAASAEKIISECGTVSKEAKIHFVQVADATLMKDVDKAAAEIIRLEKEAASQEGSGEPRIDLLAMSQGGVVFGGRQETSEGVELNLATHYLSRARFTDQLLPLLLASRQPSGARVISVYAGGMETKLLAKDMQLREKGAYSFDQTRSHCVFLKTGFFEALAARHPGRISLVHMFPGLIITPGFNDPTLPRWFKIVWAIAGPVASRLIAISPETVGQRLVYLASDRYPARAGGDDSKAVSTDAAVGTDGKTASGAYAVGQDSAVTSQAKRDKAFKDIDRATWSDKAYEYTMGIFADIEAGKKIRDSI